MRFLLDEDTDIGLSGVLRALGHEADHIEELGRKGIPDDEVVQLAAQYDVLVTLDLHRQDSEWLVVNEAMLETVRVIRLRFSRGEQTTLLDQTRMLVHRWRDWEYKIQNDGACLVTLSQLGGRVRSLNAQQITSLLRERSGEGD